MVSFLIFNTSENLPLKRRVCGCLATASYVVMHFTFWIIIWGILGVSHSLISTEEQSRNVRGNEPLESYLAKMIILFLGFMHFPIKVSAFNPYLPGDSKKRFLF